MAGGRKRKIEIAKRETKAQRSVAFSKRRRGLFQKAAELCLLSGASIAVLATPPSDKPDIFSFGHPSVDNVVDAFLSGLRPTPPTPETRDCFADTDLGLGFLSETPDSDDPEELQRWIDRAQELKNNVALLLETRGQQSACPEYSFPGTEEDMTSRTQENHTNGAIGIGHSGYGDLDFGLCFETSEQQSACPEYSFPGTEGDMTSRTLENHINGAIGIDHSGYVDLDFGFCFETSEQQSESRELDTYVLPVVEADVNGAIGIGHSGYGDLDYGFCDETSGQQSESREHDTYVLPVVEADAIGFGHSGYGDLDFDFCVDSFQFSEYCFAGNEEEITSRTLGDPFDQINNQGSF